MKENILKLRHEGKSYKQIAKLLGCAKSTVSYHCGSDEQREQNNLRSRRHKAKFAMLSKVYNFQYDRKIKDKAEDFQRERIIRNGKSKLGKRKLMFSWKDVINKFGWETTCYLTGQKINLREPKTYHFDHIIPLANGGTSELNNLGIASAKANQAKGKMFVDEFIDLCKVVLESNGYKVQFCPSGVTVATIGSNPVDH